MEDKIMDKINKNLKNIDSLLMENGFYKYISKIVNIENGISQLYDNLKQLKKENQELKHRIDNAFDVCDEIYDFIKRNNNKLFYEIEDLLIKHDEILKGDKEC